MKNAPFLSDFDAHPYTRNVFFARFFLVFFDLKIARDDSGLEYMNSDFATYFFLKKVSFFLFMKKLDTAKIQKIASVFRDFLCFCVTKIKK